MVRCICVGINQLANLTGEEIVTYSYSGDLVLIPSDNKSGEYRIVKTKSGMRNEVLVSKEEIGRGGVKIRALFLSSDERIRVMPRGE